MFVVAAVNARASFRPNHIIQKWAHFSVVNFTSLTDVMSGSNICGSDVVVLIHVTYLLCVIPRFCPGEMVDCLWSRVKHTVL